MTTPSQQGNTLSIVTLVVALLTLILGLTGQFTKGGPSVADIKDAVKTEIAAMPKPAAPAAAPTPAPEPVAPTEIAKADLDGFVKGLYFKGAKNPDVSIIEFSDFECPFCKRHNTAGTIDTVLKTYDGKINYAFAHFPLWFHTLAQKAGEAFECAAKLGADASDFEKRLFAEPKADAAGYEKVAADMKLDVTKFKACVEGGETAQKVKDQMAFAAKFGVRGTPANVVVNNKTGKFILVSGAVPATMFDDAIKQLLGN
jgi:protein-disulfide isomerase